MESKGKRKVFKEEEDENDLEMNKLVLGIMEGYSDSIIPPLSLFKPGASEQAIVAEEDSSPRKRGTTENWRERDRRVKMNENYTILESIVPGLLPKCTKEKVIQGTIEYIKYLEEKKKVLERLKESVGPKGVLGLPCTAHNSSVSVTVCGRVGFFGIVCPKRQGLVAQIFMVFQKHRAEVLAANIVVDDEAQLTLTLTVTALVNGNETTEEIRREILML